MFCDLHGHSRKLGAFAYGCPSSSSTSGGKQMVMPSILSELSECFSFEDSRFKAAASKKGTGRVVAFQQLAIEQSFTLEGLLLHA